MFLKKKVWKPVPSFIAAIILFCLFSGCSKNGSVAAGAGQGPTGKIVVYTAIYEDIIESVDKILKKKFPDVSIEFIYGGTGAIQAKVAEEIESGRLGCDMLMVAEPSYSLELKEKGLLRSHFSRESFSLAFPYDREGYWYPMRLCNMVLAYNPEKYAKGTVPNSFYDFAYNPNAKGAISMGNPITSGTTMAAVSALVDKYGYEYFAALGRQGVKVESGSAALKKLQDGEYRAIMILEESILKAREENGSKLEVIYPTDGAILIPSTIMIINDYWNANRNTAAAAVITDWFLSPEGQEAIVDGWMHSVRVNFPRLPYDSIPTEKIKANNIRVNWEKVFRQRKKIQTGFEELVMNAPK